MAERRGTVNPDRPVVLALGSNLGDREAIIRSGVSAISDLPGVVIKAVSGLVESAAVKPGGVDEDAPAYLNAVATLRTAQDPYWLLGALIAIERAHGRVRETRWGDRTLDIDIITIESVTLSTDRLTVPHPRAAERAFVLAPWLQVEPDATLPGLGRIDALLAAAGDIPTPYAADPLL